METHEWLLLLGSIVLGWVAYELRLLRTQLERVWAKNGEQDSRLSRLEERAGIREDA